MTSLFFWPLLVGLIVSVLGGSIGPLVVVKRIVFVSGSIAHSVLAGVGLFLYLERAVGLPMPPPIYGALLAAIVSALCISRAQQYFKEREDSVIATVWAAGMAIGIILLSKTPGYTSEISSILIGNLLWVSPQDALLLALLSFLCLLFILPNFQKLKLLLFDEDEAFLQGIATTRLYEQLLILVAISVVALVQVVGIVLVMTMLTLPPLLAGLFCSHLSTMIAASIGLSMICTISGLYSSYFLDWPVGATIALSAIFFYGVGQVFRWGKVKFGKSGIRTHGTRKGTRP